MKKYYSELSQKFVSKRISIDLYAGGGNKVNIPVIFV